PVVEGFILPERFAHTPEDGIGISRRDAFDAGGNPSQRDQRLQKHVDVIRYHNVRVQPVMSQLRAAKDGKLYAPGDLGIPKPDGAKGSAVELRVDFAKRNPGASSTGTPACAFLLRRTARSGCATGMIFRQ